VLAAVQLRHVDLAEACESVAGHDPELVAVVEEYSLYRDRLVAEDGFALRVDLDLQTFCRFQFQQIPDIGPGYLKAKRLQVAENLSGFSGKILQTRRFVPDR
jgi:hypothetical protein